MALKTIAIADKETLDTVNTTCENIFSIVKNGGQSGGSTVGLNKIHLFILDVNTDDITVQHGAIDQSQHYIQC